MAAIPVFFIDDVSLSAPIAVDEPPPPTTMVAERPRWPGLLLPALVVGRGLLPAGVLPLLSPPRT